MAIRYRGKSFFDYIDAKNLLIGGIPLLAIPGNKFYVEGTNGSDSTGTGRISAPYASIGKGVAAGKAGDCVVVSAQKEAAGATDPVSYAETVIIPATKPNMKILGIGGGPVQGALPQVRIGAGAVAMFTVRAPGTFFFGLGINGASSTGGGILLDDDGSTKTAFGTVVEGCHFKNCKAHATDGKVGGAVYWSAAGGAWQALIRRNRFYNNLASIVLVGTSADRPKDVVIEENAFGADAAASVDAYIYGAGGSGFNDVEVVNNRFSTVLPNSGSGTIHRYLDLTGVASGIVAGNHFATAAGQFGATGDSGKIPVAVMMTGNYIESGLLART